MKYNNSEILVLLNEDKISELRNQETLFSFKVPTYEKLAMTSQFGLTQFYDVIICKLVFNSGIPDVI